MDQRERAAPARRVTWVGFVANLVLTILKLVAGVFGHSGAMVADAVHSLSDFGTDIVVLISFKLVDRPVDKSHDYGHGKYETLAAAVIGISLLLVGAGIFWSGAAKIWASLQGEPMERPGGIAFAAAVGSIVIKELLYRYTARVGERIGSQAVIANAWHHRSDALSSVGAMLGIGGAIVLGERWRILDPAAAVIVSLFIVKVGMNIASGSIKELVEESLDDSAETEIINIASNVPGVADPHNLRTRRIGGYVAVDLHIRVAADMRVSESHVIASEVELRVRERFGQGAIISIHVEPLYEP